jgi:hypothetical protein
MLRGSSAAVMQEYADKWMFRDRRKILEREAKAHLVEPYLGTFLCVVDIVSKLATKRHEFAHHIWGSIEELPDAVLLVHPKYLFGHWGAANDWIVAFAADPGKAGTTPKFSTDIVEVWTNDDLKIELDRMFKAHDLSIALEAISSLNVFDGSQSRRDHVHNKLLNNPEVVAARIAGGGPCSP